MSSSLSMPKRAPGGLAQYVDRLQGSGRYSFREEEVARSLGGSSVARQAALRRLKKKARIVSPRRGFFVIVPVEYRSAGSPPASWFIHDLMAYLDQPYYIGLLSAAEIQGAAHQRPQVFQVVTDVPTRPIEVARLRIEFHRNRNIRQVPIERVKTETGSMQISTPEGTAIDLVRYPEACGYLGNVATVLVELAERIDPRKLAKVAAKGRHPDAQRLGYLLDRLGLKKVAESLATMVASWRRRPVLLRPDRPARGLDHDPRWFVVANEEITADL
jgi:predicted transcriptional regulator of viral defense system